MKSFAIFPTISIFFMTFTLLRMNFGIQTRQNLIWSFITTIITGTLLIIFSSEIFILLSLSNFVFALALVPFLTFLLNDFLPESTGKIFWLRFFGIGLIAIVITAALFLSTSLNEMMNNPMDPPAK